MGDQTWETHLGAPLELPKPMSLCCGSPLLVCQDVYPWRTNEDFLKKAPQEVVEGVRANRERLVEKKNRLENQLSTVNQLASGA